MPPLLAAGLSLLVPGLGQALRGDLVRGLAWHGADLALALGLWFQGFFPTLGPGGLALSLALVAALRGAVAADAGLRALGDAPSGRRGGLAVAVLLLAAGLLDPMLVRAAIVNGPARVWAYRTDTDSMAPTLRPGETVLAELQPFDARRGDVVVFAAPEGFGDRRSRLAVKRVAALGGDTVAVRDGRLLVGGLPVASLPAGPPAGPWHVPPGAVFLVGDHPEHSQDSRTYGPVAREALVGRALYVLVSPDPRRIGASLAVPAGFPAPPPNRARVMTPVQVKTVLVMLVAVVAATVGDLFMAQGMKSVGEVKITGLSSLWRTGVRIFTNLRVWAAIAFMCFFFFLWLSVLSWADLSLALPLTALTYVLNALLVGPVLGERVSPLRWAGTLLIFVGVVLVVLSGDGHASP